MSIFRTLLLSNNSEPRESQVIKYKATSKLNIAEVADTKVRSHEYDQETGEGIIVCARDITEIKAYAFDGCKELTDIVIPKGTVNIGYSAFNDCVLNSIVLPNTIRDIDHQYSCSANKIYVDSVDFWFNVSRTENCFKGSFYNNNDNKIIEVTVPNEINYINRYLFKDLGGIEIINIGNNISEIQERAFYNCIDLKTVNIENTNPVSIKYYTFAYSENLENVNTISGISIDKSCAFYSCKKLKNITKLSNSMTVLQPYTFSYCNSLESINIPSSITNIGEEAFRECKTIKHIILPDTITKVNQCAFKDCINLLTIHFPINCKSIPSGCFLGCTSLYEINIDNVTTINYDAFLNCSSLINIIFSENLTTINANAFENTGLSSVIFTENVDYIGSSAFSGCVNLKTIQFNDKLTHLSSNAFSYCSNLERVDIPNTIVTIGGAFRYCDKLKEVNIGSGTTTISSNSFNYSGDGELIINVSEDNANYCSENGILFNKDKTILNSYKIDKLQNEYTIPDSVETIDGAFCGCKYLTNINLNKVTTINNDSFVECDIEYLELPTTVSSLATSAIGRCNNLKNIYIPFRITKNLEYNFYDCHNLNINVDEANTIYCSIDGVLFDKNKTTLLLFKKDEIITNYEIPNIESLTTIGSSAFSLCKNLTSVSIPNTITTIKSSAFSNSGLITINLPESLTHIEKALGNCQFLESIYINSNNLTFTNCLLENSDNVKQIHIKSIESWVQYDFGGYAQIPEDAGLYLNNELITEIELFGDYVISSLAFYNYNYLTKINVDVKGVAQSAFYGCKNLTEAHINYPTITDNTFSNCFNLKTVFLGQKITKINSYAFYACTSLTKVNIDTLYQWLNITNTNSYLMSNAKCLYVNNKLLAGVITIPEGITTLISSTFANISFITKIIVNEGMTTIGDYAFQGCADLEEVDISSTVTNMRGYALFSNSPKLKTIMIRAEKEPNFVQNQSLEGINETGTLYYPKGSDYSTWITILSRYPRHWIFVETEFE